MENIDVNVKWKVWIIDGGGIYFVVRFVCMDFRIKVWLLCVCLSYFFFFFDWFLCVIYLNLWVLGEKNNNVGVGVWFDILVYY